MLLLVLVVMPVLTVMLAGAVDLFARHSVTVQFATADGTPMADAEVRVFAPGQTASPTATGRTDKDGKFEFSANTDGFWMAEARINNEIARASIRVGGAANNSEPVSPYWVVGGLFALLVLAFGYRIARGRLRRR